MQNLSDLYYNIYSMETNTEHFFGKRIKVSNPFFYKEKYEMVQYGHQLGVDFSLTISCRQVQSGAGLIHCGDCEVCRRRRESFLCAQVSDPTYWKPGSRCADNLSWYRNPNTLPSRYEGLMTRYDDPLPQHIKYFKKVLSCQFDQWEESCE